MTYEGDSLYQPFTATSHYTRESAVTTARPSTVTLTHDTGNNTLPPANNVIPSQPPPIPPNSEGAGSLEKFMSNRPLLSSESDQ